ncbi:DMT family transporter [Gryllotalpicola protaetiae]|uniref:DMT family transporter n=1 Tax=Gryllotalpicola protaetiae TaxID=2419771 RepID=UPI0013C40234|nr:DMT family transporter [Gryllotalpicola protaetiae]
MHPSRSLGSGVLAGIGANVIWATAFIVGLVTPSAVPPIALAVGRYTVFGLIALALLPRAWRALRTLGPREWATALIFAAIGNVGQFVLVLLSVRFADGATSTIVYGVLPVALAIWGNLKRREVPMRRLVWPVVLTVAGLALLSGESFVGHHIASPGRYAFGVALALVGMLGWAWYSEANATFLERHPLISSRDWAGAVGIGCLPLALLLIPAAAAQHRAQPALGAADWLWLIAVSIVIGILLSWVATVLWNIASLALPVSLAAQLIVVGTLAGVVMVHLVTMTWPNRWEVSGLAVSTAGVLLAVRVTLPKRGPQASVTPISPSAAPEAVRLSDVGQLDHTGGSDLGMPVEHGLDPA